MLLLWFILLSSALQPIDIDLESAATGEDGPPENRDLDSHPDDRKQSALGQLIVQLSG